MACAVTSDSDVKRTSDSSTVAANTNANTLTVKNRAAWKPAWPSPASKVQWRVPPKLFGPPNTKAAGAAPRGGGPPAPGEKGEKRGVDTEPGRPNGPKLKRGGHVGGV